MAAKPITAERLRSIEAAAACGCSDEEVAAILLVDVRKLDAPRVRRVIAAARARTGQQVAAALVKKALAGNVPAAMFYLKARHAWRDTDAALEREAADKGRKLPRVLIIEDAT